MGLIIKYKDYTYSNPRNNTNLVIDATNKEHIAKYSNIIEKYRYDDNKYKELYNSGQYDDAYNMAKYIIINDNTLNNQFHAKANLDRDNSINYRQKLSLLEKDPEAYEANEFLDNINHLKDIKDNQYAKNLIKDVQDAGNFVDFDGIAHNPNKVNKIMWHIKGEEQWAGQKRGRKKTKFRDFLVKDNLRDKSITSFCERMGINSIDELKDLGATVNQNEDGSYDLIMDKSNGYIYKFITAGAKNINHTGGRGFAAIVGIDDKNNIVPLAPSIINDIQHNINKANRKVKNFFNKDKNTEIITTAVVGDAIIDNDKSKPKTQILETLAGIDWYDIDNYKIYSNKHDNVNKKDKSETLYNLTNDEDISKVRTALLNSKDEDVNIAYRVQNGKVGMQITISNKEKQSVEEKLASYSSKHGGPLTIFVEGFAPGYDKTQLYEDNSNISKFRIADIKSNKSNNHELSDGSIIDYDAERNLFTKQYGDDIKYITEQQAINEINIDEIIDEASLGLYNHYVTENGGISDINGFKDLSLRIGVRSANDIYNNVDPIYEEDYEKILSMIGPNGKIDNKYRNTVNANTLEKYDAVAKIYSSLISTLQWFNLTK